MSLPGRASLLGRPLLLALFWLATGCGSLVSAARDRDANAVREKLRGGADPNETSDGQTPLCEAIDQGEGGIVSLLLDAKADPNKVCPETNRELSDTPLTRAGRARRADMVQALLEHGADPAGEAPDGVPFLAAVAQSEGGDTAGITRLYLETVARKHGRAKALELAVTPGRYYPWTSLSAAAFRDDAAMIEQLAAFGVDPNRLAPAEAVLDGTADEWPPFYFARIKGSFKALEALTKAGAKPELRSREGISVEEAIELRLAHTAAVRREEKRQRSEEARRRREERRQEQANQEAWQSFQSAMTGGRTAQPPTNPVDDDSFQEKMRRVHRGPSSGSAAPPPAAPATGAEASDPSAPASTASSTASAVTSPSGDSPASAATVSTGSSAQASSGAGAASPPSTPTSPSSPSSTPSSAASSGPSSSSSGAIVVKDDKPAISPAEEAAQREAARRAAAEAERKRQKEQAERDEQKRQVEQATAERRRKEAEDTARRKACAAGDKSQCPRSTPSRGVRQ